MSIDTVIAPPTNEIRQVANLVDEGISRLLSAFETLPEDVGVYEAHTECYLLLTLAIRDLETILLAAVTDLVMLPSTYILARSIFERCVKLKWMLQPADPFDREIRWLVHLKGEEEYLGKIAREVANATPDHAKDLQEQAAEVQSFRTHIEAMLPGHRTLMNKVPNMREMLADLDDVQLYPYYISLSQYTHGTHVATGLYRLGLGTGKTFNEDVSPKKWQFILRFTWRCVASAGIQCLSQLGGNSAAFFSPDWIARIEEAFDQIAPKVNPPPTPQSTKQ